MKTYFKNIIKLVIPTLLAGFIVFSSCKKSDSSGTPKINYVRVTNPLKSDSLLSGAYMGDLIAVIGSDLGKATAIWFNDQQADLNPSYVTENSIIVSIPSTVPSVVSNKMKIVFSNSDTLVYDFAVNIPGPVINSIKCEYVVDGDSVVLKGDYFFDPKVYFEGGVQAEVLSVSKTHMQIKVPTGALTGPITIKTNFGTTKTKFKFRDDSNIILDYDTYTCESWTAGIAKESENPTPAACSGNYVYLRSAALGGWMWTNELTMQYWAERGIRGETPLAVGNPSELVFRFEVNVPTPWVEVRMEIVMGTYNAGTGRDKNSFIARWKPWKDGSYQTVGWETISIPLTDFKYAPDDADDDIVGTRTLTGPDLTKLTNLTMMLFGPAVGTNAVNVNIDNVRIVSK